MFTRKRGSTTFYARLSPLPAKSVSSSIPQFDPTFRDNPTALRIRNTSFVSESITLEPPVANPSPSTIRLFPSLVSFHVLCALPYFARRGA
ncbi:hypothetical protein V5799_009400 [Amblyomma americanum]|uniref:Uncharacterized protein n=1 Tax=Amblyomma americanum TaxID=6943 RepID=A0AAQ4FAH6_AMBAM